MIFLGALSSVNATDLNDTSTVDMGSDEIVQIDESYDSVEYDDILASDGSESRLSEPKTITVTDKTFKGINNAIKNANDGDTIVLDGTYSLSSNLGLSGVSIDKKLKIIGINDATLDNSGNLVSLFNLYADGILLEGLTFKNGKGADSGGAIFCDSNNVKISNCKFIDIVADHGGAIRFSGSNFTIVDSTFVNNHAGGFGGAIDGTGSDVNIINCNFTNCYCNDREGGAISLDGVTNVNIEGCIFDSCHSGESGGAIRIVASSNINIENSTVSNSKSQNLHGGAMYFAASNGKVTSNVTIDRCRFTKNSAKNDGGAVSNHDCQNFIINNSYFEANQAQWGGALMSYNSYGECYNVTFIKNTATVDSGAVSGGVAFQCNFIENSAATYGGATSWLNSIGCTYENNKAEGEGGAMYNGATDNSKFINNTANGKGGAIALTQYAEVNSCSFINNSALYGGAICKPEGDKIDSVIKDSNFTGNRASQSGGALCIQDVKSSVLDNCAFKDNFASVSGSVDYYRSTNITISGCEFTNSTSSNSAGSIGLWDANSISLTNCNFTDSKSNEGGAIYWSEGDDIGISACKFENCISNDGNSYIKLNDGASNSNIVDCVFDVAPQGIAVSYESHLTVNNLSLVDGDEGVLTAHLSNIFGPMAGSDINFSINGFNYSRVTNSEGLAFLNVKNLKLGENDVSVSYDGKNNYLPVSIKPNVLLSLYKGNLSVDYEGIYYQDTVMKFKLTNSLDDAPIQYARVQVIFSNGKTVELDSTDANGETEYQVPFAPGTYSYVAKVMDSFVDVNTIEANDLTIKSFNGNIEFSQSGRVFTVKLYDPDTGIAFKDFVVDLTFSNGESDFIKTNNNGIARFNFPYAKGTYSVLLSVNGNDYIKFNDLELKNIVIDNEYDSSQDFISGSKVTFSGKISFNYLKSGSATVAVIGGQISKGFVINHPEAKVSIKENVVTVSNLGVGNFKLQVDVSPDEYHLASVGYADIVVSNVKTKIKVSPLTTYSKSGGKLKFKLTDANTGSALSKMYVNLKVYTGSKYKNIRVLTNSKGEASVPASGWSVGKHKVVLSFSKYGYASSSASSYVKVLKTTKLKFKVKMKTEKSGSTLNVWVKSGKKYLNGVKLKIYVYNGKKIAKKITVVTGKYKDTKNKINNGFFAYGTNALKAGKHKIVIKPATAKYTGSKSTKLTIKKTAKKYKKTSVIVTKGKRHVID